MVTNNVRETPDDRRPAKVWADENASRLELFRRLLNKGEKHVIQADEAR